MANRSFLLSASSFSSFLPSKASRKTLVSPRSFHILARDSSQCLSSSASSHLSQPSPVSIRCAPCRPLHGSKSAWAPETEEPDQSHGPPILRVVVNEKRKGLNEEGKSNQQKKTADIDSPAAELNKKVQSNTLSELVRTKMRLVPQPVTIVTSSNTHTHPDGNPEGWNGATISSFNTVTMTPVPIISFNIKHNSSTFAAIKASGCLWVHFLTAAPSATSLAAGFATPSRAYPKSLTPGRTDTGPEKEVAQAVAPIITADGGARGRICFILECKYMEAKTVIIGDHVVLFASVTDIINDSTDVYDEMKIPPQRPCLVYAEGEYQSVMPLQD